MKNHTGLFYNLFFALVLIAPGAESAVEVYTLSSPSGNNVNFSSNGNAVTVAIGGDNVFTVCRQDGLWLNKISGFIIGPFSPSISVPNVARRIGGTSSLHSDGTLRFFNSVSDQPTQINPFGGDVRGNVFIYHLELSLNDLLNTPAGVPLPTQFLSTETRIQINSIYAVRPDDVAISGGANTVNVVWQLSKIADADTAPAICQTGLARSATPVTTPAAPAPAPVTTVDSGNTTTTPPASNGTSEPKPAESTNGGGAMAWTFFLILCLFGRRAVTIVRV